MATTVEYILKLQDQMSGQLKRIETNTDAMNKHLKESENVVHDLKTAFVEFFAIEKLFEWGKEAFEAYQKNAMGAAQLEATLKSTKNAIGVSRKELDEFSESLSKNSTFSKGTITSMQSVLATFTNIKGGTFKQTEQAVADLATKMGGDLQSAAIQVGKAIQDPVKGITALRRVGVNFNEEQTKIIKNLVATGHAAKAQQLILKELNTEFGGSAAAAAKANPWKVMMNQVEEKMAKVGGLINKVLMAFMPMLGRIFSIVEKIVDQFMSIVDAILPTFITILEPIFKIFEMIFQVVNAIIQPIIKALKPALEAISMVVQLIEKIWERMMPIIMFLAKLLGGVLGIAFRIAAKVIEVAVKFVEWIAHLKIVKSIFDAIAWVVEKIAKAYHWIADKISSATDASVRYQLKKQGYTDAQIDAVMAKNKATDNATNPNAEVTPDTGMPASTGETGQSLAMPASTPKESKITNINIKIDSLVKELTVKTEKLEQSEGQIKEIVTRIFLEAVNGFNLVPGQ